MDSLFFKDFPAVLFNDPILQEQSLLQQATVLGALNRHLAPTTTQTLTSWVLLLSFINPHLAIDQSLNYDSIIYFP